MKMYECDDCGIIFTQVGGITNDGRCVCGGNAKPRSDLNLVKVEPDICPCDYSRCPECNVPKPEPQEQPRNECGDCNDLEYCAVTKKHFCTKYHIPLDVSYDSVKPWWGCVMQEQIDELKAKVEKLERKPGDCLLGG